MIDSAEQLLLRAKAGDRDALSELLMHFGSTIRNGLDINPKWRPVLEPDDVMQVTYFEAFKQISHFDGDAQTFPRWLRRIAENNLRDAVDWLEREKRPQPDKRVQPPKNGNTIGSLYEQVVGEGTSPSRYAAKNEIRQMLDAEIDKLPQDYCKILRWIFLEGKTVGEAADAMGRTRGAVHLLRIRAIDRLREQLGSGSRFFSYFA